MKKIWAVLGIMPALCGLQIDPKAIKPLDHYEMDFSHWIVRNETNKSEQQTSVAKAEEQSAPVKAPAKRVRVQKKNLSKIK